MKNMFDLEKIVKFIGVLSFLFGVFSYSLNVYLNFKISQFKYTMETINMYEKDGVSADQILIDLRTLYYRSQVNLNNDDYVNNDDYARIANEILFGYIDNDRKNDVLPRMKEFMSIVNFYSKVYFCISSDMCDKKILHNYFCGKLLTFSINYRRLMAFYAVYSREATFGEPVYKLMEGCSK